MRDYSPTEFCIIKDNAIYSTVHTYFLQKLALALLKKRLAGVAEAAFFLDRGVDVHVEFFDGVYEEEIC
jgi:hypothetical protein